MNENRTCGDSDTPVTRGDSQDVLWEVVDVEGRVRAIFSEKAYAFEWAELNLRGPQDTGETEERNGWDVQSFRP